MVQESFGNLEESADAYAVTLNEIEDARKRISQYAHETQVQTCQTIDLKYGFAFSFKCEMFQKGGAFKFRGASNAVLSLTELAAAKGVVTHSSGNHAAALALAGKLRGIPAYIVVPSNTPQCKLDAIVEYGGQVTMCTPTMDAREELCQRIQTETGATFIPPYNHPHVIAGQGTIALELLEQVPDLDAIVVPVSGGGLISGIAIAAKKLKPDITIIAAEPKGTNDAADCAAAKAAGRVVPCAKPQTIADGLQGRLGSLTWPPIRDLVTEVVTVSEEEIVAAMRLLYERMKVVVEPSGATAFAAAISPQLLGSDWWTRKQKIGIILSGGNVDLGVKGFWDMWIT